MNNIPTRPKYHHHYSIQMRFNDFDMFGHLNNTVYFEYLDMAKYAYFKQFMNGAFGTEPSVPVILKIEATFMSPIHIDDKVEVLTAVTSIGDTSMTLSQEIVDGNGTVKFAAKVIMVNIDARQGVPVSISEPWRKAFIEYEGNNIKQQ